MRPCVLLQEDGYMTKFLNYNLRSIYAFHLPPPPPSIEEEVPQAAAPPISDKVSLIEIAVNLTPRVLVCGGVECAVKVHIDYIMPWNCLCEEQALSQIFNIVIWVRSMF